MAPSADRRRQRARASRAREGPRGLPSSPTQGHGPHPSSAGRARFTFTELLRRSPLTDAETLKLVLNDEVRRGRVDYCGSSRRYVMNGGLPADLRLALRDL